MQEGRFHAALAALGDPAQTTIVLVTRPDRSAILEAARTSDDLRALGLGNQRLAINGVFVTSDNSDLVARSIEALGRNALAEMPQALRDLPQDRIPLRPFDMVGLGALRRALGAAPRPRTRSQATEAPPAPDIPGLGRLVDSLAEVRARARHGDGQGRSRKTTVAAALAVGLVQRGHSVHLSTTDPAAHLASTLAAAMEGLRVDRIDPKAETLRYIEKIVSARAKALDEDGLALLREDLASPCTEEVAVFHAFSRIVAEARSSFVILDTAPTGHTLLLLDATGAYHRQMTQTMVPRAEVRVVTPLMRLQDPEYSKILVVALPETTPISEAAALQEDFRRAKIEPYAWVINRSLLGSGTRDPLLATRASSERSQVARNHRRFGAACLSAAMAIQFARRACGAGAFGFIEPKPERLDSLNGPGTIIGELVELTIIPKYPQSEPLTSGPMTKKQDSPALPLPGC